MKTDERSKLEVQRSFKNFVSPKVKNSSNISDNKLADNDKLSLKKFKSTACERLPNRIFTIHSKLSQDRVDNGAFSCWARSA